MFVKRVLLVMFLVLTLAMFMGSVSAASNSSLTWAEVENSSYAVQSFTESKGDIPSSVSVSGKRVTDNAYLEVLCKAVVKANTNDKTSVSVVAEGNAPAPSGTASGTLTKSQYLTVANNIKSFYVSNDRAPNYAESSIGNIRYETLVYMYSKIMNYYRVNDVLPGSISFMYVSGVSSSGAYVDVTVPTVNGNIPWGTYNTPKTVTLTASDNADTTPTIYYRLNQGAWSSATKTVSLNMGKGRSYLDYYACDDSGNRAPTYSGYFTIDMDGPTVTATPTGSCYNSSKLVSLIASDNFDTNPTIYYTLNGSDPSSSSLRYIGPLNITNTTTLNFLAIDNVGNVGPISSEVYTIGNPVVNMNTGKTYSRIQDALDDVLTLNGDVIQLYSATFLENVVINKNVTLMTASDSYVVVNALNSASPVITVNSNGSGSTICGLVVAGATSSYGIHLYQVFNCNIVGNALTNNNHSIEVSNSKNNNILHNMIIDNGWMGVTLWYSNNTTILGNNITNNPYGIYSGYSNNTTVTENTITGSVYGINPQYSTMDVHFNRISGSSSFGLVNQAGSIINATNNWWGTRAPSYLNSPTWPSYYDIWNANGTVYHSPWFTSDIGFTSDQIINASMYVKNYIESNHQLPNSVNISEIQVNMPQFLKLATQVVSNADSGLDDLIVLGDFGTVPSHVENMTDDDVLNSEYVPIAKEIVYYMDLNRIAPSNISNTSLGDTMSFESLVYMYSKILGSYGSNNQTLPDSISVTPWIAVSNPNNIYNFRSQKVFKSIQSAIDDIDTIADDTISLWNGNYLENVIINKTVIIESMDDNVTVSALSSTLPVFTINALGNGSIIQNIFINGSLSSIGVYIENSFNNTILNNVITSNSNGIYLYNSTDNEISSNLISNNTLNGIFVYLGENNTFSGNNLTYNGNGIILNNTLNNTICINLISKNVFDGINILNSSADVSFNVISQNGRYGLYNQGNNIVDAQNNWWGYNPPVTGPTDIYNSGGILNCDKWIVMNVNSTCDRSNRIGDYYNYVITADLTHNQGNDKSGDGNIPDGMPVNFVTDVGTVVSTGYTRNGKAVSNLNSSTPGLANVSVTLDNQTISMNVNITSINVLGIYNNRTREGFTTIQGAINDNDTLNGDIITLSDGTYTENVVINKTVTILSVDGSLVTVTGSDSSLAVFNITSSGSGSIIMGLTIIGSEDSYGVFLNDAINCNITGNIITGNDIGIYLHLSNYNTIEGNSLIDNYYGLGLFNSTNNNLSGNYLTGNYYGVYLKVSDFNLVIGNNAIDNWDAIQLVNSTSNSILNNTIKGNWIGSYLYLSNNTLISGNIFVDNGAGICYYDSNNTIFSGNSFTGNWIIDFSEIDSSNMVVATTIYTCGPAALATVMMHMGLNATEADLSNLAGTDDTGTSMYGLVQAANAKNLTAYGLRLSIDQLKTDYIVVLSIDDKKHYVIIRNITDTTVYLIDPNLGNIEMNLTEFTNAYTGYALVINNTTEINGTLLTIDEMKNIKGLKWVKKSYKKLVGGYYYTVTRKVTLKIKYDKKRYWDFKSGRFKESYKIASKTFWITERRYQMPYYKKVYYWDWVNDKPKKITKKNNSILGHLKKGLEKYIYDIMPSQSDIKKEQKNFMGSSITRDGNFMVFAYGGDEGDDTWLHYNVVRTPSNNDCWLIECSVVYYVGDKSYRKTQYAVLLPGKTIPLLYEGGGHKFKFKIPKNKQGGLIETHTIAYYRLQRR